MVAQRGHVSDIRCIFTCDLFFKRIAHCECKCPIYLHLEESGNVFKNVDFLFECCLKTFYPFYFILLLFFSFVSTLGVCLCRVCELLRCSLQ